jgi:DNA-binding ferritin-like protein
LPLESKQRLVDWANADEESEDFSRYMHSTPKEAKFSALPEVILEDKALKKAIRELKETLYRTKELVLFRCTSPKLESKVGESRADFLVKLQDNLNESKEEDIVKLQERYAKKEKTLTTRLARAKERVDKESSDSTASMIETGIAVLGALFGKASPTKISRALRKGNKVLKERGDMSRAEERMAEIEDDIETLEYELEDKIDVLSQKYNIENHEIESFSIKPRKTDIDVELCAVVWRV